MDEKNDIYLGQELRMVLDRPEYIDRIVPFLDKPVIKVITGMRRVGKSRLLELVRDYLISRGVDKRGIFFLNKELLEWDSVRTYTDAWEAIQTWFAGYSGPRYVCIDEVQEISEWERLAASMLAEGYADVLVTGSNANVLSSELSTLIAGRYVDIKVYPLSFGEWLRFRQAGTDQSVLGIPEEFRKYLRYGGLPGIHSVPLMDDTVFPYLMGIYSTIVLRDVITRHSLRDPEHLERLIRFLFDNCGNLTSSKRLSDYFSSKGSPVSVDKVISYVGFLEQALLVHRVRRFDLRGLRHLEFLEKLFMSDIGLRHGFMGYRDQDISGLLENVVYLDLLRRGYRVSIGKWDDYEIDFVAEKGDQRVYIQVAYLLATEETVEREVRPLAMIKDNHPKYILSLDEYQIAGRNGIHHLNIRDFLLR
jgi:predicted AAA+ superfamily ATPase